MGYVEAPEEVEVGEGMYYNKWIDGNQIAMPAPIYDGSFSLLKLSEFCARFEIYFD